MVKILFTKSKFITIRIAANMIGASLVKESPSLHCKHAIILASLLIPEAFSERQAEKYFKTAMLLNEDNSL